MKPCLLIAILMFSAASHGAIKSFVAQDEEMATLIIQGQDADASTLYRHMQVDEFEDSGVLKKKIEFNSPYSFQPIFILGCQKSIRSEKQASCTFKVFKNRIDHATPLIRKNPDWFLIGINDRIIAKKLAKLFHSSSEGDVFRSENNEFRIWKTFDSRDDLVSFTVEFSEN